MKQKKAAVLGTVWAVPLLCWLRDTCCCSALYNLTGTQVHTIVHRPPKIICDKNVGVSCFVGWFGFVLFILCLPLGSRKKSTTAEIS